MIDVPVAVKETLQDGRRKKNYRFNVLHDDGTVDFTIDNDTLVSESVKYDERMCSGDTIKFGLCEGSSLEFQYFDHPNIKGRQLQTFVDVEYTKIDITKAYETLAEMGRYDFYTTTESSRYYVYANQEDNFYRVWVVYEDTFTQVFPFNQDGKCFCEFYAEAGSEIEVEYDHWGVSTTYLQKVTETRTEQDTIYPIPMGYFTAEKCSRQASTGIIKVTAYNKLQSDYLDQKANQLLLDSFDAEINSLSMYSIRNTLLQDYEITPYIYSQIESFSSTYSGPFTIAEVTLSDLVSDGGPINYYDLEQSASAAGVTLTTNTTLYINLRSIGHQWEFLASVGEDKYYQFVQSIHDLGKLTETFAQYLIDFFDACPLSKTGTQIVNDIKNHSGTFAYGWQRIMGIEDESYPSDNEYFNDYAYKYQNDGTYRVNGTTNDFIKKILKNDRYHQLIVYCPEYLSVEVRTSQGYTSIGLYPLLGEDPISYKGADDVTKTYPQYKYEDGSTISDDPDTFFEWITFNQIEGLSDADLVYMNPETAPDYTLRDIISACYETECQFGKLDRETDMFSGVELNQERLFPAEDLYPNNALYPGGAAMSSHRSMYSKLWGDEGNAQKWRYLIITYKGIENGQEKEFTLQRTVNADGNVDYNMSDNWLFKNLTWTDVQVGAYADAMKAKMQNVTWFPFEMWCPGLPYLETGDEIEVSVGQSTYSTYILQRQLNGIQNLQDTYINGTLDIF